MIDPHVHLRDWGQAAAETLRHGLSVAHDAGLDAVFDMPNTDPPVIDSESAGRRLEQAERVIDRLGGGIRYGLFLGATPQPEQLEEMVELYHGERFGKNGRPVGIVGLKLYAGPSTGNLAASTREQQQRVYDTLAGLGYAGVLCVHCEKESAFLRRSDGSLDWDPLRPRTYAWARPPAAELESVRDQLAAASRAGFGGTLHIAHVSVPGVVNLLEEARGEATFRISCEVTPHHVLFNEEHLERPEGLLLKSNPPLRPESMRAELYRQLRTGRIDFVASDHAPHTLEDKERGYASGIPGLGIFPTLRDRLARDGAAERLLHRLFHAGAEEVYAVDVPEAGRWRSPRPDIHVAYATSPYRLDVM
ncbi:MAG: dihydroorotase [Spirochaetaceae bacterium]